MKLRWFWQAGFGLALCFVQSPTTWAQTPLEAQQLQARGDWKGAEEAWRQVLKQTPDDYRVWASLGIVLSQEHRYEDAINAYRKALALQPHDGQTELNLGITYFKMGRLREAIKPLEAAAKTLGNTQQLDVLLGVSLYGVGQYRQATPYLERASAAQPGNAELEQTLGQAYLYSGAYDKAMATFKKILLGSPDSPAAHVLLGEAYDASNQEQAAIAEFRAATQGGYVPNAYFGLGYLFWKTHNYDEAATEFQKELEHDPKNSQALAYLGDVELKRGNPEKAGDLLRRSVALQGDSHLALLDLGIIETDEKQYQAAEQHLAQAVRLKPSEADAHYRLARLYQLTGRPAKAKSEFALVKQVHQQTRDDLLFKVSGATQGTGAR